MKKNKDDKNYLNLVVKIIFPGLVLGVLFWAFETLLHVFVFKEGGFTELFFYPQAHEIWMRSFGATTLFVLGAYARFVIIRHSNLKKNIEFAYTELSQIFNTAADGMRVINRDFIITRVNETFSGLAGVSKEEAIGKKCFEVFVGSICHTPDCPLTRILCGSKKIECDVEKQRRDGIRIPCIVTATPFRGENGELLGIVEDFKDIRERNKVKQELEKLNKQLLESNRKLKKLVLRDSLTGLYNHRYLEEALAAEFSRARRYNSALSVIMMDIDYFKSINEAYGHPFGDLVLRQFAERVEKLVRQYDIVVRFGGEEFVIISPSLDKAKAMLLAQRLLNTIELYNFGDDERVVKLRVSIAVTNYPEDVATKGIDLINYADQLLGKVKEDGGNKVYSSADAKTIGVFIAEENKEDSDVVLLKSKIHKLTKRANQSLIESIFAFAKTIELKDHYTGEHVENTVYYAAKTARAMNLSKEDIENVRKASRVHDLGKIGISEKILLKPDKLNKEEFDEIKKHPQIGVDIIRLIQSLRDIIPLILHHQERWDGTGYPAGLKGEEIPIGARIIALADVYQALISDRPYRKAYSKQKALEIIKDGAGSQFDPAIVEVFLNVLEHDDKE
ncbi:MAG: diguanylate cyclase [Candidatus Omnitrophota bacterium]